MEIPNVPAPQVPTSIDIDDWIALLKAKRARYLPEIAGIFNYERLDTELAKPVLTRTREAYEETVRKIDEEIKTAEVLKGDPGWPSIPEVQLSPEELAELDRELSELAEARGQFFSRPGDAVTARVTTIVRDVDSE